jgi:uncharacterized membrane protein
MTDETAATSDQKLDDVLGNLLIAGVMAAALVVAAGGMVYLARHGGQVIHYRKFSGQPPELRGLRGIWQQAFSGEGKALIQLGLLILIATPVARVAMSLAAFVRRRDGLYSIITLIVLSVLLFSLMGRYM